MHTEAEDTCFEEILPGYKDLSIAIAHYWFVSWRGGEKVVKALLELFPKTDIYTLFYDKETCGSYLENFPVYSSVLDKRFLRKRYQSCFPLYPIGVSSLRLKKSYDVVISSESGPVKGLKTHGIPHICYIHTPMRYCWGKRDEYLRNLSPFIRRVSNYFFEKLKQYDITTVNNVNLYVSNSRNVQERVRKYYKKESIVVYPPIDSAIFNHANLVSSEREADYYVSFGAITPYKRIDLLVDEFNSNGKRLIVIGEGSEKTRLEKRAASNIKFTGFLPDEEVKTILQSAKALLFPGEEDFGMIPLEVMALGLPVIAYAKGGALETVLENLEHPDLSTGVFFHEQQKDSLHAALTRFEEIYKSFDPEFIRLHAQQFNEIIFKKEMLRCIKKTLSMKN